MEAISALALLMGGSWASGLNLYLTVAVLGIAGRYEWLTLPAGLESLTHPAIIGIAAAIYLVEFFADKIPYVDSMWDSVHTFIRPLGSAALGFMAMSDAAPEVQIGVALVTGTIAMDSHLTKATTRAAINTSPEPFTNWIASLTGDAAVVGMFVLIVHHPYIALGVVIAFIVFSIWFLHKMWGFLRRVLRGGVRRPPTLDAGPGDPGTSP